MEFSQLEQFKAVAEEQNMSRAAEKLYISQPAITQSIKKLEEELGTSLFDRKGKKLSLNTTGKAVLEHVNSLFLCINNIKAVSELSNIRDRIINIATCVPNIYRYILPIYELENKGVKLHVEYIDKTETKTTPNADEIFDLLISNETINRKDISSDFLMTDNVYISVKETHPLAKKEFIYPEDLESTKIIMFTQNTLITNIVLEYLVKEDIHFTSNKRNDWGEYIFLLSLQDDVSLLSSISLFFHNDIYKNRKIVPVKCDELTVHYYVSYKKQNTQHAKKLIKWVHERFPEFTHN